jgi:hypothetical protein
MTHNIKKISQLNPRPKLLAFCILCFVVSLGFSTPASAQVIKLSDINGPLLDGEPFDLVYLDRDSENAIMRILPIENIKRPLPREGYLKFEFFEESEFVLKVDYKHIEKYVTFNELLMQEANEMLDRDEFAPALRNLLYVYDHGGARNPDTVNQLRACLFKDAAANLGAGNFELSLSIFEDLYDKDRSFKVPGLNKSLIDLIFECYDGVLEKRFELGDADFVRATLKSIEERYGEPTEAYVADWRGRFAEKARRVLQEAQDAADAGDGRTAHYLSRLADRIEPDLDETRTLQTELTRRFPLIIVGVNQPAGDANPNRLDHWGSRRVGRLTQRTIIEMTGLSDEGGRYQFLNGTFERTDNLGLEFVFRINPETDSMTPSITANQLAIRLLDHADPESPNFSPAWRKVIDKISFSGSEVKLKLRRPFVRPAALLRFAYNDRDADGQAFQNGVYAMTSRTDTESTFEFNELYPRVEDKQHPVIIEEYYRSTSDAVDALIRGKVDIVDRPSLSDIKKLKKAKGIEVRSYAIPTVHFLIPKIRGDYEGSPQLIRGLSHGINREGIVNQVFGGEDMDGCEPLSGPFPIGSDEYDQVSYGYDLKVKTLQYQRQLAMVLVELSKSMKTKAFPQGRPNRPAIVLAHPASSTASIACLNLQQAWEALGVSTTLRELDESISYPNDDNWDMLYVEAAIEEPLTDANRIMGPYGLADSISAPIEQALQKLSYSDTWQGACRSLRLAHRQVANDLSVIPLYQIKEHFAYRKNVYGLGRGLIHLYQNVSRWRIEGFAAETKAAAK